MHRQKYAIKAVFDAANWLEIVGIYFEILVTGIVTTGLQQTYNDL